MNYYTTRNEQVPEWLDDLTLEGEAASKVVVREEGDGTWSVMQLGAEGIVSMDRDYPSEEHAVSVASLLEDNVPVLSKDKTIRFAKKVSPKEKKSKVTELTRYLEQAGIPIKGRSKRADKLERLAVLSDGERGLIGRLLGEQKKDGATVDQAISYVKDRLRAEDWVRESFQEELDSIAKEVFGEQPSAGALVPPDAGAPQAPGPVPAPPGGGGMGTKPTPAIPATGFTPESPTGGLPGFGSPASASRIPLKLASCGEQECEEAEKKEKEKKEKEEKEKKEKEEKEKNCPLKHAAREDSECNDDDEDDEEAPSPPRKKKRPSRPEVRGPGRPRGRSPKTEKERLKAHFGEEEAEEILEEEGPAAYKKLPSRGTGRGRVVPPAAILGWAYALPKLADTYDVDEDSLMSIMLDLPDEELEQVVNETEEGEQILKEFAFARISDAEQYVGEAL